jgi:hypothetical protein
LKHFKRICIFCQAPALEDDVDLHFIAFVQKDGNLYELDGAKPYPINHGATGDDNLLEVNISYLILIVKLP